MDMQARKLELIRAFLNVEDEGLISRIEKMLIQEWNSSVDDEVLPMTIEELNERIDKSMEDSKNGRLSKASDLKSRIDKWT